MPIAATKVTTGTSSAAVTTVVVNAQRDLALARLKTPITAVAPVALAETAPAAGDELTLAGFGRTATDWNTGKLRSAKFKVDGAPAASFDVVATGSDAVGLCKGDAGGPALRQSGGVYQLAGLHHAANQAQCLGEAAGDPRGTETRVDDMRGWVTGNLTGFDNGFEVGETTPTWTNTKDDNGGVTNVIGICCDLAGPELFVGSEWDLAGNDRSLMYSGYDNSTTSSYAYMKAFDMGALPVRAATVLSYWVYPQSNADSWGLAAGSNSTCIGVDLVYTDNTTLRDSAAVDTRGVGAHPAKHCGKLTLDTWNQIVVPIGKVAAGKRISRLAIAYDQPANTGGYRGYIDDISVSEDALNTGLETGQYGPKWTNTVATGTPRGGIANIGGVCCNLTGPELFYSNNAAAAHTGNGELLYSGKDNSTTSSYAYMKVFGSNDSLYVTPTTRLSYWIFPQSATGSGGYAAGNNSTCVGVDLIFKDAVTGTESNLRDTDARDEWGNYAHPAYQCGALTLDTWNYVSVPLGTVANGKQIAEFDIGYDQAANTGGYRGLIDDIRISR